MKYPAKKLPPRRLRKAKRIKVGLGSKASYGFSGNRYVGYRRVLTYHVYGRRPRRGEKVRIRAGLYKGDLGTVTRRHSFWRGYTYLAEIVKPKEWRA